MRPVNSFTEWGRLEEVILGSHYRTQIGNFDTSMELLFHDNFARLKRKHPTKSYTICSQLVEEREEDTAEVAALLVSLGITVRRPEPVTDVKHFTTPYWSAVTKACDNPRDQVLIVGDRIIETSCLLRNRYFENDLLKPVLYDYFRRGARWICAPRPMMTEESFDRCYVEDRPSVSSPTHEIMFDAAQCLRFGRDIVMNVSTENHELGFQWLRRELEGEFRLHKVSLVDNHLDGAMMPIRLGTLLVYDKMRGREHLLPKPLQKWNRLHILDEDRARYSEEELLLASTHTAVNVLPLDEERLLINEFATETIRLLEKTGFTPIPVRFRHSRIFAGGLHCVTLDVRRRETLEDYFT